MDLGLERAGMVCRWQVEINAFCQKVLAKHWPYVPRYGDITKLSGNELEPVDVIAGGFPCQDVSNAGSRVGLDGPRSGLWFHMYRLVSLLRPRFVIVENTTGLLARGMGRVLSDFSEIGFDAEWSVVSACSVGLPHTRERVFIVAYPAIERREQRRRLQQPESSHPKRYLHQRQYQPEPSRVAYGLPNRVDRNFALGNAIVPSVSELIGRRVMSYATESHV